MKETKFKSELLKLIKRCTRETLEREMLIAILKAGGSMPRVSLLNQFVPKHMSRRTFHRKVRFLLDHRMITRTLGKLKDRHVIFYELGPVFKPNLLDIVDRRMYDLTRRAFLDLEFEAKTDEQRQAVIERVAEDLLTLQRSFTLKTTAHCLHEPDERDIIPGFLWLMDNIPTQAASHLFAFCLTHPEISKPVIDRLAEEAGKAEDQILKLIPRLKKAPPKGRR